MEKKNRCLSKLCSHWDTAVILLLTVCMCAGIMWHASRWMPQRERSLRSSLLQTARVWLDSSEADGSHEVIIDRYNAYDPSPRDYEVQYDDNWCATFGSAAAMETGLTHIIPPECSCEQQINRFMAMGRWQEDERYLPRTGDYIYYVWDEWRQGNCTAWADHVGIVEGTFGPVIKVLEGNKEDTVGYRYIFLNDITIRGFGLPDYAAASAQ